MAVTSSYFIVTCIMYIRVRSGLLLNFQPRAYKTIDIQKRLSTLFIFKQCVKIHCLNINKINQRCMYAEARMRTHPAERWQAGNSRSVCSSRSRTRLDPHTSIEKLSSARRRIEYKLHKIIVDA